MGGLVSPAIAQRAPRLLVSKLRTLTMVAAFVIKTVPAAREIARYAVPAFPQ
jgi:hypothetical protein